MLKSWIWNFAGSKKNSKSKIWTFRGHLSGWLDAKSFDLNGPIMLNPSIWIFFRSKNFQIENFKHPRVICRSGWMLTKSFEMDGSRMLKSLICMFLDPKTSKSNILATRAHLSGWLDATNFRFGWPQDVKIFDLYFCRSKKVHIDFKHPEPSVRSAGC